MNQASPAGRLRTRLVRGPKPPLTPETLRLNALPQPGQPAHVKAWKRDNEPNIERGMRDVERGVALLGSLWATVHHGDGDVDLGLVSARVVTNSGVNYIVQAFQNLTELETFKYHAIGTGVTAENAADTALGTEATTQYNTTSTRPTGSLGQGGAANTFETVATVTVKAAIAVTEHGIFTQAAAPGGTLLDRSMFAVVNLASGEGVSFTYDLTFPSGS